MQKPFEIKGIRIGEEKPVVCIPVVEQRAKDVVEKIRQLAQKKTQMIEWRVDCFDQVGDLQAVAKVLEEAGHYLGETVFLFTFRTRQQGGNCALEEKKILQLNEIAAKSGCVDLIDLEFFEATRPEREIRRFQRMGVRIIASHHDFGGTPDERILHMLMDQMQKGGADIAKLAVMPHNVDDVLRLLKLTADTKQKYPTLPVVTMSMGGLGTISRISGEVFGSCITFGTDGAASAPGQLPADMLDGILDALHGAMINGQTG